jgi:succinyl-CoA synthetase beta subunit
VARRPRGNSDRLPDRVSGRPPPMDLLEYQGKQLFAKHGIAVPSGEVAANVDDAVAAAERIGYPCAIKAQVLIGGRGKAGGIKIAKDAEEAREYASAIIGMDIVGPHGEGPFRVGQVWVEGGSDIASEYYASVILDRGEKKLLAMVSAKGGMDIEAVAAESPEALVKRHIDPTREFDVAAARQIVDAAGLDEDVLDRAAEVLVKLATVATSEDASLIEVNPLIVTADRDVVALDAKVTIDGNALFRHQDLAEIADTADDPQEAMAKEKGLTYVKLDGNVGILANGAGLCMSTLDVVAQAGGAPANFLDAGGGSKAEAIVNALEVIVSDQKVRAILFNIFGGITRCDEIAKGIVTASAQLDLGVPLVVRLDGTNSEQGLEILAEADLPNLHQEKTMLDAARRVVELAADGEGV